MEGGGNSKLGWVLFGDAASVSGATKGGPREDRAYENSARSDSPLKCYCIPRNPSSVGSLHMSIRPPERMIIGNIFADVKRRAQCFDGKADSKKK